MTGACPFHPRFMLYRTSSAVNGLPSENFTSFRMKNVMVLPSWLISQRSAVSPTILFVST